MTNNPFSQIEFLSKKRYNNSRGIVLKLQICHPLELNKEDRQKWINPLIQRLYLITLHKLLLL